MQPKWYGIISIVGVIISFLVILTGGILNLISLIMFYYVIYRTLIEKRKSHLDTQTKVIFWIAFYIAIILPIINSISKF